MIFLTLISVTASEFRGLHLQIYFLHRDLQPTEGAIQPTHQQVFHRSVLTTCLLLQSPQAEGLSPAQGRDL